MFITKDRINSKNYNEKQGFLEKPLLFYFSKNKFRIKFDFLYIFFILFVIVIFYPLIYQYLPKSFSHNESRAIEFLKSNNQKTNDFLISNNYTKSLLTQDVYFAYLTKKFIKENEILKNYRHIYSGSNLDNFGRSLTKSSIYYLDKYNEAGLNDLILEFQKDGIFYEFEEKLLIDAYNKTETTNTHLLELIPYIKDKDFFKSHYEQEIKKYGFIRKEKESILIDIIESHYLKMFPQLDLSYYQLYQVFEPASKYRIEEIEKDINELRDKTNSLKLLNKYKESDGFISYIEIKDLEKFVRDTSYEQLLESKSRDIFQFAASEAIKLDYSGKDLIQKELNEFGFIRVSFLDTLEDIYKDNHPFYNERLFFSDGLKDIFHKLNNKEVEMVKNYYLNECKEALLYYEDLKVDFITEAIKNKIISVYVKNCG